MLDNSVELDSLRINGCLCLHKFDSVQIETLHTVIGMTFCVQKI